MSEEFREEAEDVIAEAEQIVEAEVLAEPVEEDLDELSRIAAERDEYLALAQRMQADFENYKKRAGAQVEQEADRRVARVVSDLLPVLDSFDLAEGHLPSEGEPSAEAQALVTVRAQLLEILSKLGLEPVPGAGEPFDPEVHEAVAHAEGESESGPVVDEVLRAGYGWRGTVLRAAMVRVRG